MVVYLIGWDPTTIPLQLSALSALSACSFEKKNKYNIEFAGENNAIVSIILSSVIRANKKRECRECIKSHSWRKELTRANSTKAMRVECN